MALCQSFIEAFFRSKIPESIEIVGGGIVGV